MNSVYSLHDRALPFWFASEAFFSESASCCSKDSMCSWATCSFSSVTVTKNERKEFFARSRGDGSLESLTEQQRSMFVNACPNTHCFRLLSTDVRLRHVTFVLKATGAVICRRWDFACDLKWYLFLPLQTYLNSVVLVNQGRKHDAECFQVLSHGF